jgi:hypothetical protein
VLAYVEDDTRLLEKVTEADFSPLGTAQRPVGRPGRRPADRAVSGAQRPARARGGRRLGRPPADLQPEARAGGRRPGARPSLRRQGGIGQTLLRCQAVVGPRQDAGPGPAYAALLAQPPRPMTASHEEAGRTSTLPT